MCIPMDDGDLTLWILENAEYLTRILIFYTYETKLFTFFLHKHM